MNKKQKLEEQAKLDKMTKYDRKKYLRGKKEVEEKRKKIIYSVAAILGIIGCIALVFLAKESQRKTNYETYLTVGDQEISRLEFDYYYCMNVNNWLNTNYYYLSYYGVDPSKDLSTQIKDEKTKETWQDYFVKNTKELVTNIYSIYSDAQKNNFTDWETTYNEFIEQTKNNAEHNEMKYMQYVKAYYGNQLSEKDFEEISKKYCMTCAYDENLYEKFEDGVTAERIESEYNNNKDDYDTVDYLLFTMSIADQKDITDDMKKDLKNKVTNAVVEIKDKDSFIKKAKEEYDLKNKDVKDAEEFDEESIVKKAIGIDGSYTTNCGEWLYNKDRKAGDVISLSDSNETTYYILYFLERKLDTDKTVNLRVIYQDYVADDKDTDKLYTKKEAQDKMQKIADDYVLKGADEKTFETLAIENGFSDGGLNKYISKNSIMVDAIGEWAFAEGRKKDDIKIVEEDNVVYLLYFIEEDQPYYQVTAKNSLAQTDYDEYIKKIQLKLEEVKTDK